MALKLRDAKWCPLCGAKAIDRDDYRKHHTNRRGNKQQNEQQYKSGVAPEFLCRACGAGFRLSPSMRYEQATSMIAADRKHRPPMTEPTTGSVVTTAPGHGMNVGECMTVHGIENHPDIYRRVTAVNGTTVTARDWRWWDNLIPARLYRFWQRRAPRVFENFPNYPLKRIR